MKSEEVLNYVHGMALYILSRSLLSFKRITTSRNIERDWYTTVNMLYPDISFFKLVTLLLNLNTYEKSKSEGNEVVASEVVGVGVGVACCGRGLKNGGVEKE
ncbi:hypothetical protein Tco_0331450 [Tanacetum coccineum]